MPHRKFVDVFDLDEYVGIDANHPASFRRWIRERIEDRAYPASVNYIKGNVADVDAEIERYSRLLLAGRLDIAFVGFGENGHIAFNDPPVADFSDPQTVKRVTLDADCREQQVGEGHFESVAAVPAEAITVSCTGLFRANAWICCVPESRKAKAVDGALNGVISTACPASIFYLPHPSECFCLLGHGVFGAPKDVISADGSLRGVVLREPEIGVRVVLILKFNCYLFAVVSMNEVFYGSQSISDPRP